MLVCDGQCVGKVCGVKVKSDTSYRGRSVLLASCFKQQVTAMQISLFLIVLLIYRRAPRQQLPGSVLLYYHSQQQLSMEKYMSRSQCQQKSLNQKEGGKKKIPFFLRHLLSILYDKIRCSPSCWHGAPVLSFWPPSEEVPRAGELLHRS